MRTIGDGELNRRAPLEKYTTADLIEIPIRNSKSDSTKSSTPPRSESSVSLRSLFDSPISSRHSFENSHSPPSSSSSPMSTDVVQEANANNPTPTVDNKRARIKWTNEMNEFIWRTYLVVTELETKTKGYLNPLHQQFIVRFPQLEVSKQRIGDQRRAILRNKLLSAEVLEDIKEQVTIEFSTRTTNIHTQINTTQSNTTSRLNWTNDINEAIIRKYYEITELEKNKTAYRKLLHTNIIHQFPQLSHVSEQRIADQRRLIINNKYISSDRLKEIKNEVDEHLKSVRQIQKPELNINTQINSTENLQDIQNVDQYEDNIEINESPVITQSIDYNLSDSTDLNPATLFDLPLTDPANLNTPQTNDNSQILIDSYLSQKMKMDIKITFQQTIEKYQNTEPTSRPFIPKQTLSRKFAAIVKFINLCILPDHVKSEVQFLQLQTIIYCSAFTAAIHNGSKIYTDNLNRNPRQNSTPSWQRRLQGRIDDLRVNIGRLTEYIRGNKSNRLQKFINTIKIKYKIHSKHEQENKDLTEYLDTLKQKLSAYSNRLRRYKATTQRKTQNTQFKNNEKLFYRNISTNAHNSNVENNELPEPEELYNFWSNIWSIPVQHNDKNIIYNENDTINQFSDMTFDSFTLEQLSNVLVKLHNWKATGSDKIHNYWYKYLTTIHPQLLTHINTFIESPETMPNYITQGITYMLPKDKTHCKNPAKYRPITCLQNIYKIITSCISKVVYRYIDNSKILAEQQKGCRKNSQGCKEQLTIDAVVSKQAYNKKRNIYTMYIDYQKAFDSVPHSWLIHILEMYRIHPKVIHFLKNTMQKWTTKLRIHNLETAEINIRRGIFQGDSLSPLWFCLALNPLSNLLNNSQIGFKLKYNSTHYTLSHLMYMDDIKLYGSTLSEINKLASITQQFSTDICMSFGIDKCRIQSIRKGKIENNTFETDSGQQIEPVDNDLGYKYLGYQQTRLIHQKQTKLTVTEKFRTRLHKILNTQLNSRNIIKAINTYAVPVLTYSFGIVHWSQTDLKKLQRTINTLMTKYRKHHPRSCIERLTLPRHEGGRGLIDIQNLHNKQIKTLRIFFHKQSQISILHEATIKADQKLTPLNLQDFNLQKNENTIADEQKIISWTQKSLHGRHRKDLINPNVDRIASNLWLKRGDLFSETEGFIIAIQDQIIDTRNYQKHITHTSTIQTDLCRRCHRHSETIQHITGACPAIAQTDYKHRHDQVAAIIHQYLARKYSLEKETVAYYKYKPTIVLESSDYKLYWDRTIITDKTVHFNRPDITLHDKKNKKVFLIDIAVPNTHNLTTMFSDKLAKYTDLSIEIKTQWQVDTVQTIPITLSCTGVIPKTLKNSLSNLDIPSYIIPQLQKAVILNTCRMVRKFLAIE